MIERLLGKVLSRMLTAEVMTLALLLVALQSFTSGVASSLRNPDPNQAAYFFWVGLIALLIALGLSKLKLKGVAVSVVMIAAGIAGIWILGARLTLPLLNFGKEILIVVPQIIPALRSDPPSPIDTTGMRSAWLVVAQASGILSIRVQTWLIGLSQNARVNDALVRSMVWTLIMWLSAGWMGWFAGRRNAVVSLLPSMLLLAVITSYSDLKIYTLWLMVSAFLLLMGIWNYKEHAQQWDRKKIDYSDSIRYDIGQAVLFLTIVIGALTFITPSISWREIRDYLRERDKSSENQAADVLGLQQQRSAGKQPPVQKPSLPRDHLLGGGLALSKEVVMTIRTGELPPIANPSISASVPRHYWRSTTYDTYAGAGWITSKTYPQRYQANTPLIPGLLTGYQVLHLDVRMAQPEGKLFWSGILFSADVPLRADWRVPPQPDLFTDQATLLQTDMFAAASSTRAYRAEVYIPRVTVAELRAASTDYPEEVRKYYLQLPSSVPERVRQLAQEITQGKKDPYDQAKAIEAYLRANYPYDLEVPAPPEGQDVADYFLFDLRKGYCDYYATAMVVLARSSGIPARFVSGYSSGSYDEMNAEYIVRELNAHSWAEVYFPEIGWVEFEPTASQPEVELPLSTNDITASQPSEATVARLLLRLKLEKAIQWAAPILIVLFTYILYFVLIERWWYMHLVPAVAIEKMYRRLYRLGRPLAGELTRSETAYEFMQKLVDGIETLEERSRFAKLFFSAQQDIELLTGMYQAALFSHNHLPKTESRKALQLWKHLRPRLLLARWSAFLQKTFKAPASQ